MMTLRLTRWHILLPVMMWGLIFLALTLANFNRFQLLNIFGFLFLAIVPGLLTILAIEIENLNFWAFVSLAVGFSLLELMTVAVLGNAFLPFAGIARPLDKLPLSLEVYLLIAVLLAVAWLRVKEVEIPVKRYIFFDEPRDIFFSLTPVLFVVLAIFGAIRLNNDASNILTMIMLGGMSIYIIFLIAYAKKLDENAITTSFFFMGLALLLMTSLRGWYITGHDIQTEYKVFELAKNAGIWKIATYQDAYNACLSITILPTLFANLLSISDPYIFKLLFQFFFALCPGLVYLTARHWANTRVSLLATIYFIGFATFFSDMPFLIRQEIAFVFYGLMLYLIFNPNLNLSLRRRLFMLMGIGVILSHYSTTYTILVILGLAIVSRPFFVWVLTRFRRRAIFKNSAIMPLGEKAPTFQTEISSTPKITFGMVLGLFVLSFLWTSIITHTGGSVMKVMSETVSAVKNGFAGNNRSMDAVELLSFGKPDQNQELQDYINKVAAPIRNAGAPGEYFDPQTYSQYKFEALPDETLPITPAGQVLERIGIDVGTVMPIFAQVLAKLMEILAPIGMIYLLFNRSVIRYVDDEIYLIAFYCLFFVGLNIVLPVLSTEYGIFRAMQQSMFIIGPIIVAGSILIGNVLMKPFKWISVQRFKNSGEVFAIILVILFFSFSTSVLRQFFGGNIAVLHLANAGNYNNNYLIRTSEVTGVDWLTGAVKADPDYANGVRLVVQADRFARGKFASLTTLVPYNDIFPSLIRKQAYVFLSPPTVTKQRAIIIYNADQVTYTYPTQFLADNKNLIYTNGSAEVYR